ncbi:hypothetical protein HDU67_003266 [Dinochytrium kinnereticum]|nr:hypothetical protein HDU67_003266 [Dinochytrium kinnereticum]
MAPSVTAAAPASVLVTPPTTPPFDAIKTSAASPVGDFPSPANYVLKDIRGHTDSSNTSQQLSDRIVCGLSSKTVLFEPDTKSANPVTSPNGDLLRSIPTLVLYDDRGLDLFDQITYLDEYYLTNAEIQVFNDWGDEIISTCVEDGGILVELGVGSMRKTKFLLEAIVRQNKSVTYYALDLSEQSLVDSLKPLAANFPTISFVGLLGTYEDSLAYISRNVPTHTPQGKRITRTILWLGSSIGNMNRDEAAEFLGKIGSEAMSVGDTFLCGIDRRNTPIDVKLAYDDPKGVTREFIMNGLDHVDRILGGGKLIDRSKFEYLSIYNEDLGRHEAYFRTLEAHKLSLPSPSSPLGVAVIELEKSELINIEYSVKYSPREVTRLADRARLHHPAKWTDRSNRYDVHLFAKGPFALHAASKDLDEFVGLPLVKDGTEGTSLKGVPTVYEFEQIWKAWDTATCSMIRSTDYLEKPISLRHPYVFYLGHIPAFMDIQISRCLNEPFSEPVFYTEIFERGIDPDMEDTTKCHPHSQVPDTWPAVADVMAYRDRVRERIRGVLAKGVESARLARVLWMCYEHDAMHLETILYMLVQSPNVKAPEGFIVPPHLFRTSKTSIPLQPPASFFPPIPADATITLGHNDPEAEDADDHENHIASTRVFGWDNERPSRTMNVSSSPDDKIQTRPVTVHEYHRFLSSLPAPVDQSLIPESWVGFEACGTDEPAAISTKVKTVYGAVPIANVPNWPVFASHVQAKAYVGFVGAKRLPTEAEMVYLRRRHVHQEGPVAPNVGFRSWHPEDVVEGRTFGDGWEWTDTVLERHEGYESSVLYPGYTSDFFDEKHNILVGGSWATAPRIAHRDTFRNWYQRGYPFVFATFRCVF